MTKLLLLDKDGTLVRPKSGGEFVQHPEDQELLPGVAEAIARYAADGWTMAIVSNQGGCQVRKCMAEKLVPNPASGIYLILDGVPVKVLWHFAGLHKVHFFRSHSDSQSFCSFDRGEIVQYQYKTLDDAIAEMQFTLELLPQDLAIRVYFCPDGGRTCYAGDWRGFENCSWLIPGTNYRKPEPGILFAAIEECSPTCVRINSWHSWQTENCLMVGDRPEDQQAAESAGVPFMWADEWRNS